MSLKNVPQPRLCHVVKWKDFDGYGFNLHGEKERPGQFIGKVDDDSPASHGGLKPHDRIIEVNGTNICNENHQQVVQRIKAVPNETKLLVVDQEADNYYKSKGDIPRSSQPNVIHITCPPERPSSNNLENLEASSPNGESNKIEDEDSLSHSDDMNGDKKSDKIEKLNISTKEEFHKESKGERAHSPAASSKSSSPPPMIMDTSSDKVHGGSSNTLDLNMTAQEMKAKLAARKTRRVDIKNQNIDLQKKYQIIQTL